jgi:cupin 2 domain-containing protein
MPDGATAGRLPDEPPPVTGERFVEVARVGGVVVEHISSSATPDDREQCQDHDEWVVLLNGSADLEIDGVVSLMTSGTWVLLPAGTVHRVLRTEPGTRWLALRASAARPATADPAAG